MNKIRLALVSVVLAATAVLSGCGSTKINRILSDPTRYNNRDVSVEGRVVKSVGAFVAGVYEVEDDTGKIYVLSTGTGVPRTGSRVKVDGKVTPGVNVMGKSFGTTIREHGHRVRY